MSNRDRWTHLSRELILLSICGGLAHASAGCNRGEGKTTGTCTPMDSKKMTTDEVRAYASARARRGEKEEPSHLEEKDCGSVHVMIITNGYVGDTYYLRDGVVIGESSHTDYGKSSCSGEISACD